MSRSFATGAACVAVTVVLAASACGGRQDAKTEQRGKAVAVTAAPARARSLQVWERAVGQIEATQVPLIAAEVAARVEAIRADEGDLVEAGQVLAEMDPTDYRLAEAAAKADIERVEALLRAQKLDVRRLRALVKHESASQSGLDNAEARLASSQAKLAGARVRLQQARRSIDKTTVRSPLAGQVDERRVSAGDYVRPGMPLFRVVATGEIRVRLPFPERLLPKIHPGQSVRLVSPVDPTRTVEAAVTQVRPMIVVATRSVHVLVDLPNPSSWRVGASVTGEILTDRRENAVVVRERSLVRRPGRTVVYVVDGEVARERVVSAGLRANGDVEITKGLEAGEMVIEDGAGFLTDDARIEVVKR